MKIGIAELIISINNMCQTSFYSLYVSALRKEWLLNEDHVFIYGFRYFAVSLDGLIREIDREEYDSKSKDYLRFQRQRVTADN